MKARAGASETIGQRTYRWIEVEVNSGVRNEDFVTERVKLLIDELAYRNNKRFVVLRGWHELGGEVFPFRDGHATQAEDALGWLERAPSARRFSIHNVLTLLFDAPSQYAGKLRTLITTSIAADPKERDIRSKKFDNIAGQGSLKGYEVTFNSQQAQGLNYTLQWSRDVPFGFVKVALETGDQFKIVTTLDHFAYQHDPLMPSDVALSAAAQVTTEKLEKMSVRTWTIQGAKTAHPVGQLERFRDGKVTIRTSDSDGGSGREFHFRDLSPNDQKWIFDHESRITNHETGKRRTERFAACFPLLSVTLSRLSSSATTIRNCLFHFRKYRTRTLPGFVMR